MSIKMKLKEILKKEIINLILLILILVILFPFIKRFITVPGTNKLICSKNKLSGVFVIFMLTIFLLVIIVKKVYIIKNVIWSIKNYVEKPREVYEIFKKRRASLISISGYNRYYELYNDVLKAIESMALGRE